MRKILKYGAYAVVIILVALVIVPEILKGLGVDLSMYRIHKLFTLALFALALGASVSIAIENKMLRVAAVVVAALLWGLWWQAFWYQPPSPAEVAAARSCAEREAAGEFETAVQLQNCLTLEREKRVLAAIERATTPTPPAPVVEQVQYEDGNCVQDPTPGIVKLIPLGKDWQAKPYTPSGCDVRVQTNGPVEFTDGEQKWKYDPSYPEESPTIYTVSKNARKLTGEPVTLWYLLCDQGQLPRPRSNGETPWECEPREVRVAGTGDYYEAGVTTGVKFNLGVYRQR